MKKAVLRKLTDLGLWFLFCFILGSGLLLHYRLVPGYKGGRGLTLYGLTRHDWGGLHLWAGYLFLALLLVHLALNYAFIKKAIAKGIRGRVLLLVAVGLAVIGVLMFSPLSERQEGHGAGLDNPVEPHLYVSSIGES